MRPAGRQFDMPDLTEQINPLITNNEIIKNMPELFIMTECSS